MKDLRLITFRVGPETFVVDIMAVRQILQYAGSTSVPSAPSFIEGIIVLRNEVVPVVDLRDRLYPDLTDRPQQPLVLITHAASGLIGLKVDEVRRIVTVPADALLPPPPLIHGVRGDLLVAIVPHGEEVYLLIDLESILTDDEQKALQGADLSSSPSSLGTSDR